MFRYNNLEPQSNPGRGHFRLILSDSSDCSKNCWLRLNNELYFSFFYILDDAPGWHVAKIPLVGGRDATSPLWLTGWAGALGNKMLDLQSIQGYTLEFNIDSQGGLGTETRGRLALADLRVLHEDEKVSGLSNSTCYDEPLAVFKGHYKLIEFAASSCCEMCNRDAKCIYYQTNKRDCIMFDKITPQQVQLRTFLYERLENGMTESASKQGLACGSSGVCTCSGSTIDCSSATDLTVVPVFSEEEKNTTTTVDLSNSASLALVSSGQFADFQALRSIHLQNSGVVFVSHDALPASLEVLDVDVSKVKNLALGSPGHKQFDNVCCSRAKSWAKTKDGEDIFYCSEVMDTGICADCVFENNTNYRDESLPLAVVKAQSLFGDAADSHDKCGELCHRTEGCLYFTLDARESLSESICYLRTTDRGREPSEEKYISGYVSKARALFYNATAYIREVNVDSPRIENNFTTTYHLSLGNKPLRGAVWLTPRVKFFGDTKASVKIEPAIVVIYPEEWDELHQVTIIVDPKNETGGMDFEISHELLSCDKAFMQHPSQLDMLKRESKAYFLLPMEELNRSSGVKSFCLTLAITNILMALSFLVWTCVKKNHPVVKASQSLFLAMIAVGGIVSSMTTICIVIDDTGDIEGLARSGEYGPANAACMGTVWLYSMGFVITLSPLFAKTWRLSKIVNRRDLKRVKVTNSQVFRICAALIAVDALIIAIWSGVAPLKYFRVVRQVDVVGNPLESYGTCRSDENATAFLVVLGIFHAVVLVYGNWICYQTKRLSNTVLSEGKYVQVAMFSNLQVLGLGVPLLIIVSDDSVTSMFVRSGVIFLNDATCMLLIFVPKIIAVLQGVDAKMIQESLQKRSSTSHSDRNAATVAPTTVSTTIHSQNNSSVSKQ